MTRRRKGIMLLLATVLLIQPAFAGLQTGIRPVHAAPGGPLLIGYSPADNAASVAPSANLALTFDENVIKGTGSAAVAIYKVADNTAVESFVVSSSSRVTINGTAKNIVTIDPAADFIAGTSYYVLIDAGAFRSETEGANYGGLSSATGWNFTAAASDTTAPVMVGRSTSVDVGQPVSLTFDEPVYAANGTVTFTNTSDASDTQAVSVVSPQVTGSGTPSILVNPGTPLRASGTYIVTVSNGALQDFGGTGFPGVSSGWTLTVNAPPMAMPSFAPADNSSGVPLNGSFTMTFGMNVLPGGSDKQIRIKKISDNSTVQSIPVTSGAVSVTGATVNVTYSGALAADTGYYILVDQGAFKDAASGNVWFQGITDASTWNISTSSGSDSVNPTVTELVPAANGILNALSFPLEMTFSEPVYPGTGNVVIRNTQNDMLFETIPVTSSQVVGGGTAKIKITPSGTFVNNSTYYVQIGNQAFRDSAGNRYAGIADTDKTSWRFTATQDTAVPTIASLSPANNTQSVPLSGGTFAVTFSEPVRLGAGAIVIRRAGLPAAAIATTAAVDSADSRRLVITPTSPLVSAASYYMEIPAGAVEDLAGNDFGGILNEYGWAFKTLGSDTTAPALSGAAMSGSGKIVLNYSEALDTESVPAPGSFYVTVSDSARAVTNVAVSGQTVTLTLQSGIVFGQAVKLYYSQGTAPIRDLSLNKAANLTAYTVANSSGSALPAPTSGSVSGNVVTLIFSEQLQPVPANAYNQFVVNAGGSSYQATGSTSSGDSLFLTIGTAVTAGQTVSVSYSPGSYPLKDRFNNAVSAFSGYYVRNTLDATAPVLQTATVFGSTLTLNYNEGLRTTAAPASSQFAVAVAGAARTVTAVTVANTQVTLTLGSAVTAGQTVTVSYLGGSPALADLSGNPAPAFSGTPVTNVSTANGASITSATVKGTALTLSFNQTLRTTAVPLSGQFSVKENGTVRSVTGVSIDGSGVKLQLFQAAGIGATVTVSYFNSAGTALLTAAGETVQPFTDYPVSNQTAWTDGLGGDFEAAAGGGINLKTGSTASTSRATSSGGLSVNQYSLYGDKITAAYNAFRTSGADGSPRVVFTVPSSESAAIVSVPVTTLDNVGRQTTNASFAVKHKDVTYEIPLNAIDYSAMGQLVLAGGGQGNLAVEIDSGSNGTTAQLQSAIASKGLQMQGAPVDFQVSLISGSTKTAINSFDKYATRTISTAADLDPRQTAVVWLDPQTGMLSYVPTRVTKANGITTVAFRRKGNSAYAIVKGNIGYNDVDKHWARNDILLLVNKLIAEGRSAAAFEPAKPITRGEFAVYIARGLGLGGSKQDAAKFKDVSSSTAMGAYIGAASAAGIVTGMPDGTFKPNSPVTREQMAAMLIRAVKAAEADVLPSQSQAGYLARFKDSARISGWARTDVAKAVEAKIINGGTNGNFSPGSNATRAEAVVMIKRLLVYVKFMDE